MDPVIEVGRLISSIEDPEFRRLAVDYLEFHAKKIKGELSPLQLELLAELDNLIKGQ